eukprot:gene2018-2203_t
MAEEVDYEEEEMNVQLGKDQTESTLQTEAPSAEAAQDDRPAAAAPTSATQNDTKIKKKGRGHQRRADDDDRYSGRGGVFERLAQSGGAGPLQSIEGWIVFVTNVHPEATEDHLLDKFSEFGQVKNIHLILDRRTGYVKGYALIEYESFEDAQTAIKEMNGGQLLDREVSVGWAFNKK